MRHGRKFRRILREIETQSTEIEELLLILNTRLFDEPFKDLTDPDAAEWVNRTKELKQTVSMVEIELKKATGEIAARLTQEGVSYRFLTRTQETLQGHLKMLREQSEVWGV